MVKLTQHCDRPEIPELEKLPGQPLPSIEVYISLMQVCAFVCVSNSFLQQLKLKKSILLHVVCAHLAANAASLR